MRQYLVKAVDADGRRWEFPWLALSRFDAEDAAHFYLGGLRALFVRRGAA